ncbi:MAG TPA: hypothetical protein VGK39_02255, partial [Cyclobacteriaceae bacterium]
TVEHGGITFDSLKEDVIDHLCCVVEVALDRKKNFDEALKEALAELAPDGLQEIQRETVFLLNSTKIIRMKQVMYSIGLLSAMSMSIGWTFKWLHYPGADELSLYGFLGFALVFLPLIAIDYFKVSINKALNERLKIIFGLLSAFMVAASITIRIMHADFNFVGLPASLLLLLAGCISFTFGYLPFLFFTMYKKSIS